MIVLWFFFCWIRGVCLVLCLPCLQLSLCCDILCFAITLWLSCNNLGLTWPDLTWPCLVLSCLCLRDLTLPYLTLPYLTLPCLVLSWLALCSNTPLGRRWNDSILNRDRKMGQKGGCFVLCVAFSCHMHCLCLSSVDLSCLVFCDGLEDLSSVLSCLVFVMV